MNKHLKKIASLFYAIVIVFSIFLNTSISGQASYASSTIGIKSNESSHITTSITPMSDDIGWRYEIKEDGKLYKRLYNYTTRQWIGDWILIS